MKPTQDALIRSKIPPGYERLAPGTIVKEGDLAWNFLDHTFQPMPTWFAEKSQRRVGEFISYVIRKVIQEVQQEQTVSQDQAPKPNYGLW